ncbi:armadillo-type protein [Dichomitus squalens]|uniref:U3 small nucleolar RNA-associated protein 10 n=1 Tax=Dichomitus squalens TaxID=114155 RepID=A0A4V2K785_9APHY|nr:armadillo-type protein [Dichomitus squalens]
MASSLAQQLAKGASLNANLLNEKSRKQAASESYLFSAKEARQHDIDSLHALGVNGFLQLKSLQPDIARFEQTLFSDTAKSLDRTLLPKEMNAQLDATISAFLPLLGPFLLDAPSGKVLEWLVRRFRIHEFNIPSIVSLFLPYHETPHFVKMVSILHISDTSSLRFLQAYKATAKPLHRPLLINDMITKPEVARFVSSVFPTILKEHGAGVHRALIAFHTGVLLEYVAKSKTLDENAMALLLPAAMEPVESASSAQSEVKHALLQESILGSYLILAAISQKARLTSKATKTILAAVVGCAERVSPKQLTRTLVSICAPQDQLEKLSGRVVKTIVAIPGISAEIVGAMAWAGAEKFISPFIESVLSRVDDASASEVAEAVLTSSSLLPSVAGSAAASLLRRLVGEESADTTPTWRQLLSQLHQRHPKAIQAASRALVEEDEECRDAIEQIVLSLAVSVTGTATADAETASLFVGSSDADVNVRAKAVRDLVLRLAEDSIPEMEVQCVASALLLRVHDTSASVLQALYTTSPENTANALLAASPGTGSVYLDALKQALNGMSVKPSRDATRAHLTFLLTHFLPAASRASAGAGEEQEEGESEESRERSRHVFMDILLPFLLYSKPRLKTAQAVWGILEAAEENASKGFAFELLGGCVEAVRWEQARPGADKEGSDPQLLTKINLAVAAKIADNILASNYFRAHLDLLLTKLRDENSHARALSYLVTRALLSRLSDEQRIDAGHRVLDAMQLDTLEGMGDFMHGIVDVGQFLDDASVGFAVVLKPSSQNTLHRLQVSVLSVLPNFPRPQGVTLEWLAAHPFQSSAAVTDDARAARYVQLFRAVYRLSNSSASLPLLSTHLLRTLFINLGDDALAFLAGVWLTATEHANDDKPEAEAHIQYAALRHAGAFLEAHVATGRTVDFQTILPAMLVALQSHDASVREAAVRCIAVVIKLTFSSEAESVYAFDAVYGADSAALQYLDWTDFQRYMKAIADNRDNLVHDPEYLQAFHREHLDGIKGESKRTAAYKQRVLCYLLSHINCCPLLSAKITLLRSVDLVSNEAKAQVLVPTIELVFAEQDLQDSTNREQLQDLATFAASTFDASSVGDLNNTEKPTWALYERILTRTLRNGVWERARAALLHRLQRGLFAKLNVDRKTQLCRTLIQVTAEDDSLASVCKNVLADLLDDVTLVTRLLVLLQPQYNVDSTVEPVSKRPRVEKTVSAGYHEELSALAVLVEVIGSSKITGSFELVSSLLDTLNKVANNSSPDAADRRFVEQLLMAAIEHVVRTFPTSATVAPGSIRVDTLVEILRTSEDPQTFHQACLLMATLARIAPDAVLHNVMPIFTFMGSIVFHRDDTYSFRVVQKTIESIVPVMVSSLRTQHGSGTSLYLAAREFLRIFTNAANHVPRHRRVNFFSHLVDTLGPADFLSPSTMLLVDRVSTRVVRQNTTESSGSLYLPLAVHEKYSAELQLASLVQLANEVHRLVLNEDPTVHPLLEDTSDDEQAHADQAANRRATALLIFCDHALGRLRKTSLRHSEKERKTGQELLSLLLNASTAKPEDAAYVEIASAARSAMASTLGVMSAPDFIAGILTVLESGSVYAQTGAFELLGERLNEVAEKARRALTPSIIQIVDTIRHILSTTEEVSLIRSALRALGTISNTLASGEEGCISTNVPFVLGCLSRQESRISALQTLLAFSSKLGPRAIPHLKDIVTECVRRSREAISSRHDPALISLASNVLRNLLTSIPTFWGESEVLQVIELFLDGSQSPTTVDASEMSLLVKTAAKRTSPNILLPALCNMWTRTLSETAKDQTTKVLAYIQVVKVSIKAASRPAVLENLRELFKTFLSMFNFSVTSGHSEIEGPLTNAFVEMVVKLNETAFRPIFRKMFDWAFADPSTQADNRKVVFCHVYLTLLDYFKALMVSYMSFAWQIFLEHLRAFASNGVDDGEVWLSVLQTVSKSMAVDEDRVFWRSDKLRQLQPLVVQQVPLAVCVNVADRKTAVSDCLIALLSLIDDDIMSKSLNLDVLMHSRSEDARVRLFSLSCAESLWRAHGDKLLGFVAETATFIAEAAEDENDRVVQEAHRLKAAVEAVGGSIDAS